MIFILMTPHTATMGTQETSSQTWNEVLTGLGVEEKNIDAVTQILHEQSICTVERLRDLLGTYETPVGRHTAFIFDASDFLNDLRGAKEKITDLVTIDAMFRSHHVEPWKNHDT